MALKSRPVLFLTAALGGLLFAFIFSASVFRVAGTTVEARVYPASSGVTVFELPPVGEIKAHTHRLPVGISLALEKVSFGQVRQLVDANYSQADLMQRAEQDLSDLVRAFVLRLLVFGALGGLAVGLVLPSRTAPRVAAAALVGLVAVAGPATVVAKDYDVKAWSQPKYSGMLVAAPWLMDTVADKLNEFDVFRDEMRQIATNLYAFYSKVDNWEPVELGRDKLKVLQVGDVHNNPVAFDIMKQLVRDFQIDVIVDTGDLTDLGTPIEIGLVDKIAGLGVPYVFIPGNHDSPVVLAALEERENVMVAQNQVVGVEGLRIFGLAEPASAEFSAEPSKKQDLADLSHKAVRHYRALKVPPDIVAAHSIEQVKGLIGRAPVILSGHTHRPSLAIKGGTVVADVGTSGAAGIRNFEADEDLPYSFKLLHFNRRTRDLLAVDSLGLSGFSRDFVLERRLINGNEERLLKTAGSAKLDVSWKPNP